MRYRVKVSIDGIMIFRIVNVGLSKATELIRKYASRGYDVTVTEGR